MFNQEKLVTAVDIGSSAVKQVTAHLKDEILEITDYSKIELSTRIIKSGRIQKPKLLTEKLGQLLQPDFANNKIITAFPGASLILKEVETPRLEEEELAAAVEWQAQEFLPFPVTEAELDFTVLAKGKNEYKVLIAAVPEKILNEFKFVFEELSLALETINIQPAALLSLLKFQGYSNKLRAVFDLGAEAVRVIVGNYKNLVFAKTLDINESRNNEIDADGSRTPVRPKNSSIEKRISQFLKYYSIQEEHKTISEIAVCGGRAADSRLISSLTRRIATDLKVINPFIKTNLTKDKPLRISEPEYALAAGLLTSEVLKNEN